MFENQLNPFQNPQPSGDIGSKNIYARQYNTALSQFKSTLLKGKIGRLKKKIIHSRQWLYDLNVLKKDLSLRGSFYSGIQVVPIHSIIGSEGKTAEFDLDFHPTSESSRERWVSMAMAHLSRLPLPPVQLIRIGDAYFVRDGHHRISVSRAFGQVAMDAEVITWKAAHPYPWQVDIEKEVFPLNELDLST